MSKTKPGGWRRWAAVGFILSPLWLGAIALLFFKFSDQDLEVCHDVGDGPEHCVAD